MLFRHHLSNLEEKKVFVNLQDYFKLTDTVKTEVSKVSYIKIMDATADCKNTLMELLHNLYDMFIQKKKKSYLLLEGDAKLYEILVSLKIEYGSELNWMLPYPGDWHMLMNFQYPLIF